MKISITETYPHPLFTKQAIALFGQQPVAQIYHVNFLILIRPQLGDELVNNHQELYYHNQNFLK